MSHEKKYDIARPDPMFLMFHQLQRRLDHSLSEAVETPLDTKSIDWQNQLFKKDLVVMIATKYWLPELGFGFVEEATAAIERFADVRNNSKELKRLFYSLHCSDGTASESEG